MRASELIGKNAVRTRPAMKLDTSAARAYMTKPIKILKVTDTHIVYTGCNGAVSLLPYEYLDEFWIDYDQLIDLSQTFADVAELMIEEADT